MDLLIYAKLSQNNSFNFNFNKIKIEIVSIKLWISAICRPTNNRGVKLPQIYLVVAFLPPLIRLHTAG